jgi:hypothetical protein
MKKHIIAYRVLETLGVVLFLIGLVNLALDYQLPAGFQLTSVLFATGGLTLTVFASIMVDACKIRAKTEHCILDCSCCPQCEEEIDEEVTAFLQDSPNLSPKEKEAWRKGITAGARAEELCRLRDDILDSIKDEFYPDGDDDDGLQCTLEEIERKFNAYINANQ